MEWVEGLAVEGRKGGVRACSGSGIGGETAPAAAVGNTLRTRPDTDSAAAAAAPPSARRARFLGRPASATALASAFTCTLTRPTRRRLRRATRGWVGVGEG